MQSPGHVVYYQTCLIERSSQIVTSRSSPSRLCLGRLVTLLWVPPEHASASTFTLTIHHGGCKYICLFESRTFKLKFCRQIKPSSVKFSVLTLTYQRMSLSVSSFPRIQVLRSAHHPFPCSPLSQPPTAVPKRGRVLGRVWRRVLAEKRRQAEACEAAKRRGRWRRATGPEEEEEKAPEGGGRLVTASPRGRCVINKYVPQHIRDLTFERSKQSPAGHAD